LLPLALRDLHKALDPFVAHLHRANERGRRPRQRDVILGMFERKIVA
jgi:hypothetical protein